MYAGSYVGIGDYRPRYGRFEVIESKEILKGGEKKVAEQATRSLASLTPDEKLNLFREIARDYGRLSGVTVAERWGIPPYQVPMIAAQMRKRGVNLPKFSGTPSVLIPQVVDELNDIVKKRFEEERR